MAAGRIRVDGQLVGPERVWGPHDRLTHRVHRHEPPVLREVGSAALLVPLQLTGAGSPDPVLAGVLADVVPCCKPCSIPVHACGRFYHATLIGVMRVRHPEVHGEEGWGSSLYPCNRIDRATSGLVLLARTRQAAGLMSQGASFLVCFS